MTFHITFTYCSHGDLGIGKGSTSWNNQFGSGTEFQFNLWFVQLSVETFRSCPTPEAAELEAAIDGEDG